jgi:type III pantothenate kinase
LAPAVEGLGAVLRVLACQVAGAERAHEFAAVCASVGRPAPREPRLDLAIECRDTHTIGRDRLFAARGAWELLGTPAIVVDAGTALTVDALGRAAGGGPSFLGGAIAPGPLLLAASLASGAEQLFEVTPSPRAAALGRDSREALTAGVSVGFVGAAKELVLRIGKEAGLEDAPLVLTGGAASFLADAFEERHLTHEPELVARGLIAADAAERAG